MRSASAGRPLLPLCALVCVALAAARAGAQEVRGRVLQEDSGEPVLGAFVKLMSEEGARRDAALTGTDGTFALRAPAPGRYRISVQRIGLETWTSSPLALAPGESVSRVLSLPLRPVRLSDLQVSARRRCVGEPSEARAAHRLWEEARKALEVTAWAHSGERLSFTTRRYQRLLEPGQNRVVRERDRTRHGVTGIPYVSASPEEFQRRGYVRPVADSMVFYGPDAEVLLSEAFVETHCFSVTRRGDGDGSRVGLRFRPVPGRREPDIRGVLWMNPETAGLEEVRFDYVNLPAQALGDGRYGGRVEFGQLSSGLWYVKRWELRLPVTATEQLRMGGRIVNRKTLQYLKVGGGEVLEVRQRSSERVARGARIRGTAYDSLRDVPLPGARVSVLGTELEATTDGKGEFTVVGVPPGAHRVVLHHPLLEALDLPAPEDTLVVRPRGRYRGVRLAPPSMATLYGMVCGDRAGAGMLPKRGIGAWAPDSAGFVVGRIGLAEEPKEVRATVRATWTPDSAPEGGGPGNRTRRLVWETRAGPGGAYRLCGVPMSRGVLELSYRAPGHRAETVRLEPPDPESVLQSPRLSLDGAVVAGAVFDSLRSRPLAGARIKVRGTVAADTTGEDGRFLLSGLPSGRVSVGFSHPLADLLGVKPPDREVSVEVGQVSRVELSLPGVESVRARVCPGIEGAAGLRGVVAGVLRNASGEPVEGGEVALLWRSAAGDHRQLKVFADGKGRFRACGVPVDRAVQVQAARGSAVLPPDTVRVSPERGFELLAVELAADTTFREAPAGLPAAETEAPLAAAAEAGEGEGPQVRRQMGVLIGTVRSAETGRPLPVAEVVIGEGDRRTVADSAGRFVAEGLPPGRMPVEVRYLGFASRRAWLTPTPGDTIRARFRLETDPVPLPALRVAVEGRRRAGALAEFWKRRERGGGFYLTPEEVRASHASETTDLLRQVPGVQVGPCVVAGGPGRAVRPPGCQQVGVRRGGGICRPTFFVDGGRVSVRRPGGAPLSIDDLVPKSRVAAVEVYTGPAGLPAEFSGSDASCGAVVIWTRRGSRSPLER